MRFGYDHFEHEGQQLVGSGQNPSEFKLWSHWRNKADLVCTIIDPDGTPKAIWTRRWNQQPLEWKDSVAAAALKSRFLR